MAFQEDAMTLQSPVEAMSASEFLQNPSVESKSSWVSEPKFNS